MLLLSRSEVSSLLGFSDYVDAVEQAFRLHAEGHAFEPALSHVDADEGEFHIKAGGLRGSPPYFALKVNGGFFQNRTRFSLPNIQGLIVLSRADNGVPVAAMDSIEITMQRTGAATAVAAKYLARPGSRVCTICGCGTQGRVQLRALSRVLELEQAFVWSRQQERAQSFAAEMTVELGIPVTPVSDIESALDRSDVCVTCTPAKTPFVPRDCIPKGMFIAAIGADSPDKQELDATLVASAKLVTDLRAQAVHVGEIHHAVAQGLLEPSQVHAELGEIIAQKRTGRTCADEIIIFDSTGTALQDVAAAAAVYERARKAGVGLEWNPA
jgi:ornithine cyclodeaminase/alanine dehydrogenase